MLEKSVSVGSLIIIGLILIAWRFWFYKNLVHVSQMLMVESETLLGFDMVLGVAISIVVFYQGRYILWPPELMNNVGIEILCIWVVLAAIYIVGLAHYQENPDAREIPRPIPKLFKSK